MRVFFYQRDAQFRQNLSSTRNYKSENKIVRQQNNHSYTFASLFCAHVVDFSQCGNCEKDRCSENQSCLVIFFFICVRVSYLNLYSYFSWLLQTEPKERERETLETRNWNELQSDHSPRNYASRLNSPESKIDLRRRWKLLLPRIRNEGFTCDNESPRLGLALSPASFSCLPLHCFLHFLGVGKKLIFGTKRSQSRSHWYETRSRSEDTATWQNGTKSLSGWQFTKSHFGRIMTVELAVRSSRAPNGFQLHAEWDMTI